MASGENWIAREIKVALKEYEKLPAWFKVDNLATDHDSPSIRWAEEKCIYQIE